MSINTACPYCWVNYPTSTYKYQKLFDKHLEECEASHGHEEAERAEQETQSATEAEALSILGLGQFTPFQAAAIVEAIKVMGRAE